MKKPLYSIKPFIHNEEQKRDLFGFIGEYCASKFVREVLGGLITSELGQFWFVALTQHGEVMGFASILPQKGKAKMAHLCVDLQETPDVVKQALEKNLINVCEEKACQLGLAEIHTVDYVKREQFYFIYGWQKGAVKGQFATYTKELK